MLSNLILTFLPDGHLLPGPWTGNVPQLSLLQKVLGYKEETEGKILTQCLLSYLDRKDSGRRGSASSLGPRTWPAPLPSQWPSVQVLGPRWRGGHRARQPPEDLPDQFL